MNLNQLERDYDKNGYKLEITSTSESNSQS